MTTATHRWLAVLLLALAAPAALAQTDTLGDEFIFFVDGTNVLVPTVESSATVADPLDPSNTVVRFNAGGWAESGFAFNRQQGIDATANVGASYGQSDTLYFRMLSDEANAATGNVAILLADATNDSGVSRADAEAAKAAGNPIADYLMRLVWTIPAEDHDGEWHEYAIPLPPATRAALEAARANGELMDGAENWQYTGAWSAGGEVGFGIGSVGGIDPPESDPLWEEFGWDQLYRIGPFWDNAEGGGPIYLDDVYIGGPSTSTADATGQPTAMSGVTFAATGSVNTISWNAVDGAGGYNVYASLAPITNVDAQGVTLLKRVSFSDPTSLVHRFENPHPNYSEPNIYYAVTSLSQFGVENKNVSASAGVVVNEGIAQKPYIRQITDEQANALFDAINAGSASDAGFPADQPVFVIDTSHRTILEGTSTPTDEDLSGRFKVGFTSEEEWFVYGEISDELVALAPEGETGDNTYRYDSVELVIGHYDVRTIEGGNLLLGSPHTTVTRGSEPDYQVRIAGKQNQSGEVIGSSTYVNFSLNEEVPNATTAVEKTSTGWRFLTLLPMNQVQSMAEEDVLLPVPGPTEIQLIPFSIAINDADATGQRESQITLSVKPNVTNQWYITPAQWEVVAIAGNQYVGTAEEGTELDGFSLAQSTPNPVSGTATLAFSLGAPRHATVEVFNVLGQRVLTAVDGQLPAGPTRVSIDTASLAAGVYVYRLSAGDYVATGRMTVVR